MASNNSRNTDNQTAVVDFSMRDFIESCIRKWPWFAASVICCVGLAYLYCKVKEPIYERTEEILITDADGGGGMGDIANAFSAFGFGSGNKSAFNEIIALNSQAVLYEVAKRLDLDMAYTTRRKLTKISLWGGNLPVCVVMQDLDELQSAGFKMELNPDGSATLSKFYIMTPDGKEKLDGEVSLPALGKTVKTPIGPVTVSANPAYTGKPLDEPMTIKVAKSALQNTVEAYQKHINVELVDTDADVIGLTILDANVQRAVAILDNILKVYTENYIADKNKIAVATSAFIEDRLRLLQTELGDVDTDIAQYHTSIGTPSIEATTAINMQVETEMDNRLLDLSNRLQMARFMLGYVENPANANSVIPVNTGLDDSAVGTQIHSYNELLLSRQNLVENSSEANPLIPQIDRRLNTAKDLIVSGLKNDILTLETNYKSISKERNASAAKVRNTPNQSLQLLSTARQQKVKEALYLFLLQKREENQLTQKFAADNMRMLTPPMGSLEPVKPKKALILIAGFLLGLFIPLGWLYIKKSADTKVRSRRDLDHVRIPFAGEIPQVGKRGNLKALANRKHRLKNEKAPLAVVENGKRDIVNEAFRVIRGNLDFMGAKAKGCQVVLLTSFNPGSGKSFISYNLSLSFALKNKRVLLIDCDLRHGSASMYVNTPKQGLTDYLTDRTDDWRDLIVAAPANPNLFIMPTGKMPPNPAELLEDGRMKTLIEQARQDYDYIFLDCPPVNIVVDTQILGQFADSTIFVVRAGLLERSALNEINEFYEEKRFNHMSVVLNGTDSEHSRYYSYGNYQSFAD